MNAEHWVRLFNRLEAAITHHERDEGFPSDADEALWAARHRVLRDAAGDVDGVDPPKLSQRVVARDARAPAPVGTVLAIEGNRAQVQWDDEKTWSRVDLLVAAPSDHQATPGEPGKGETR